MLPYLGIYNPGRSSHGKAFLLYLRFFAEGCCLYQLISERILL
jgi:hypothetical protein